MIEVDRLHTRVAPLARRGDEGVARRWYHDTDGPADAISAEGDNLDGTGHGPQDGTLQPRAPGIRCPSPPEEGIAMPKDPECGMQVDEKKAAATSVYKGITYYFCVPGCKEACQKDRRSTSERLGLALGACSEGK